MASADRRTVAILNVPVATITEPELIGWIEAALASDGPVRQIVTYNPEYAIAGRKNPDFLTALQAAELVTADGVGITLAGRIRRGSPPMARITGVRILEMLAATGAPLFLLGAGPGVAEEAARRLIEAHPETSIAGWWSEGTPDPGHDEESLRRISASGAKIVAVAYGAPGQVFWIERNRPALSAVGVRIAVGIGGALDYWSGLAPRPPRLFRRLGLEWLFRLIREPRRWRRQLALPWFAVLALVESFRFGIKRPSDA